MTSQELKVIMKLIDLHTITHYDGYGNGYLEITADEIKALKKDVQELFETPSKNEVRSTTAREILKWLNSRIDCGKPNGDLIRELAKKYGVEVEE